MAGRPAFAAPWRWRGPGPVRPVSASFMPDTFWPIAYAVALVATSTIVMLRAPRLWPVLGVMLASWVMTRTVSAYDLPGLWQAAADIACGAALIAIRRLAMVVLPVAALYLVMIFAYAAHDAGVLSRDAMWAWADVSGYLQLLIILAASFRGSRRAWLGLGNHPGRRFRHSLAFAPVRVSREPISGDHPGGG
jgi:hypothetical protein